mmetsp:Transcript_19576/g.30123  ORF Transcript_19576/g.30123 Transcript_19576/m.30123 type:complete len:165 (+) Transcript_19576:5681-6175(+)
MASVIEAESSVVSQMFPFDETVMGCLSKASRAAKRKSQTDGIKQGLIKDFSISATKKSMKHTYKITFPSPKEVTRLQLYFAENQGALFKFVVQVSNGTKIVHHSTHNESSFARLTKYKRSGVMSKENYSSEQDESLALPVNTSAQELEIVIIYSSPSSQLSAKN